MKPPLRVPTVPIGGAFPWPPIVPPGHCELCHRRCDMLAVIEIAPGAKITYSIVPGGLEHTGHRTPRRILACRLHAGGNGAPFVAPNTTMARGTSALRPQDLRLFDAIPYDGKAGRHG